MKIKPLDGSCKEIRLLAEGEKDGLSWYIGKSRFNFSAMFSNSPMLAYVDVTQTKLDGINDFETINLLGVRFFNGCTFANSSKRSRFLDCIFAEKPRWIIGEDYFHYDAPPYGDTVEGITWHLETEVIPSIYQAFIKIDLIGMPTMPMINNS